MKKFLNICLFVTLCFAVPSSVAAASYHVRSQPADDYGVGFSLSLDYGTCSIYFENGSVVDVAKIEGNSQYKHVMRHLQDKDGTDLPSKSSTWNWFLSHLEDNVPNPSLLRSMLKRWHHTSPDAGTIRDMLVALKTSAETYLGVDVHTADAATPMLVSPYVRQMLKSASSSAGLDRVVGFGDAGMFAAMANDIGAYYDSESCPYDSPYQPQLILTVDYSRAALTATLYEEEGCVFLRLRTRHDVKLGADAMDRCQASTNNEECYKALTEALLEITKMPVENTSLEFPPPHKIGGLVLLGEKGTDPRLRQVLQHVLLDQGISVTSGKLENEGQTMVDPVFAAARGVAGSTWVNQRDIWVNDDL